MTVADFVARLRGKAKGVGKAEAKGTVAWVINVPGKGSGGHRTIFQNAHALEQAGYRCDFFLVPDSEQRWDLEGLRCDVVRWFGYDPGPLRCEARIPAGYDAIIATAWMTARYVALQPIERKYYFVQDYEPWFYAVGDDFVEAAESYALGLQPITIGRWLARKLEPIIAAQGGGVSVPHTDFGVDAALYRSDARQPREYAICAIHQPEKPRRLSRLLEDSLRLLLAVDPDLKVYLYGSGERNLGADGRICDLGVLSPKECAELYRRCMVGLSFSPTNPSRVPFEMMACGLPVVETAGENGVLDFPPEAVSLVGPDPAAVAAEVVALLRDGDRRAAMGEAGVGYGVAHPLSLEGEQFVQGFHFWERHPLQPADAVETADASKDDIKALWDDMLRQRYLEAAVPPVPLRGDRVAVILEGRSGALPPARVAVWAKEDRSDLQWVDLRRRPSKGGPGPEALECDILFPEDREERCFYNFHLHSMKENGEYAFAMGFAHPVEKPKAGEAGGMVEKGMDALGATLTLAAR